MARTDAVAAAIAELKGVDPRTEAGSRAVVKGLAAKSNLVVAKAAELVKSGRLEHLIPQLIFAFERFMADAAKVDPGCTAKAAIADALYELEANAEGVFLRGIHHFQPEGVWGGSVDTAADLRGVCALGLVRSNYRDVMDELAELLVDKEATGRLMAARAIAYSENEAGGPLLRMKVLAGDDNLDVWGECLTALLRLTPRKAVTLMGDRFLDDPDPERAQVAILALGSSRQAGAFELLRDRFNNELMGQRKSVYLLPISLTRLPQSLDFLLGVVADEHKAVAAAAVEALKIHGGDEKLRGRVLAEVVKRADPDLRRAYDAAFEPRR